MTSLSEEYKKFKEASTAKKSVRHAMFISVYRNMELYIGIGDLDKGTNFYVNWKNGTKSGLIGWKNIPFEEVKTEFENFKFI